MAVARVAGSRFDRLWGSPAGRARRSLGMLIYSAVVTLYLAYLGFAGGLTGVLLWPAVVLHVVLMVLLGRIWLAGDQRSREVGDGMA